MEKFYLVVHSSKDGQGFRLFTEPEWTEYSKNLTPEIASNLFRIEITAERYWELKHILFSQFLYNNTFGVFTKI